MPARVKRETKERPEDARAVNRHGVKKGYRELAAPPRRHRRCEGVKICEREREREKSLKSVITRLRPMRARIKGTDLMIYEAHK